MSSADFGMARPPPELAPGSRHWGDGIGEPVGGRKGEAGAAGNSNPREGRPPGEMGGNRPMDALDEVDGSDGSTERGGMPAEGLLIKLVVARASCKIWFIFS